MSKAQDADEAGSGVSAPSEDKREATASARAALLGFTLDRFTDGARLLSYAAFSGAGHVRTLPSLQAVEGAIVAMEELHAEVRAQVRALAQSRRGVA